MLVRAVYVALVFVKWCHAVSSSEELELICPWNQLYPGCLPKDEFSALNRDTFFIFNSINSLLRQWGNSLSPHGFSYTKVSIPANTILYHSRSDADPPPSPEWLAFDHQMSTAITWWLSSTTYMRTYRANRELKPLLYLDGASADLFAGALDSQDILLHGRVNESRWHLFDELGRAKELCAWGSQLGVEGFVRMNMGFELMWCDFNTGLDLVMNVNISEWRSYDYTGASSDEVRVNDSQDLFVVADEKPSPWQPYLPRGQTRDPFVVFTLWEWLRSATDVYSGAGECRINLDSSSFITAYGRSGVLISSNDTSRHRLVNVSSSVVTDIQTEVASIFSDRANRLGMDWRGITDQIIFRYGHRLADLRNVLQNASQSAPDPQNDAIQRVRMLVAGLVLPYYTHHAPLSANVEACTDAFTYHVTPSTLDSNEQKILYTIRRVNRVICEHILGLHMATDLEPGQWANSTASLMQQLDWSIWTRCDQVCGWNEVCLIPIWPVATKGWGQRGTLAKPRCANMEEMRTFQGVHM